MATKLKLKSLHRDLDLIDRDLGVEKWEILNFGKVKPHPEKSETYICTICIVPAFWSEPNSLWYRLSKNDRKARTIYKPIDIDKLTSIIPGTILDNRNKVLGINSKQMRIPINSQTRTSRSIKLRDIIGDGLLENTPLFTYKNIPCFKIEKIEGDKIITCILPSAELARFYFFSGSKLTRNIMTNSYANSNVIIPGKIEVDDVSKQKTAIVEMEQGFSQSEQLTLAKLSCCEEMRKSASRIYKSILAKEYDKEITYIDTNFFQKEDFEMGVTGYYIDSPHNTIFYGNQIHQTDEHSPFDVLICKPTVDRGRKKEEKDGDKLKTTKKKKKIKVPTPGSEPRLVDSKPFSGSTATVIQSEVPVIDFYEQKEIPIINFENEQLKKYQTQNIVIGEISNNVTTNQNGTALSDATRAIIENLSINEEAQDKDAILVSVQALSEKLKKEKLIVSFFNPTLEEDRFQDGEYVITPNYYKHRFVVMQLTYGLSNYYLFDFYYGSENINRAKLIYDNNKAVISNTTLDFILSNLKLNGYDWDNTFGGIQTQFTEKGFNHNLSKDQFLSGDRIAAFIKAAK